MKVDFNNETLKEIGKVVGDAIHRLTGRKLTFDVDAITKASGNQYLQVISDDIEMQPAVFKRLYMYGEGKIERNEYFMTVCNVQMRWSWECFDPGCSSTNLCVVSIVIPDGCAPYVKEVVIS